MMIWVLPFATFVVLALAESLQRNPQSISERSIQTRTDHALNLAGLLAQGCLVPLAGYLVASRLLAPHLPHYAGSLEIGWLGAFLLNFVAVDFLYYWQHRLFHRAPALWMLHRCHHASPLVNVWATSRNSLAVNFLFVYLLVNPVLGFLCDRPDGFFTAAALTASLDLWRHSRLPVSASASRILGIVLITPAQHHAHHGVDGRGVNFGANLIVWDKLFGTARAAQAYPGKYGAAADGRASNGWRQFFYPW